MNYALAAYAAFFAMVAAYVAVLVARWRQARPADDTSPSMDEPGAGAPVAD